MKRLDVCVMSITTNLLLAGALAPVLFGMAVYLTIGDEAQRDIASEPDQAVVTAGHPFVSESRKNS